MRVLVTCGAGFIGSHLVDALVNKGHRVSIIDNLSTGQKENINPRAKFYKIDIRSSRIVNVFKKEKPNIVYHCAAQINLRTSIKNPIFDAEVNILGSIKILELCREFKVNKFIYSSTGGAIYGETKNIPTPENRHASAIVSLRFGKINHREIVGNLLSAL